MSLIVHLLLGSILGAVLVQGLLWAFRTAFKHFGLLRSQAETAALLTVTVIWFACGFIVLQRL